MKNLYAAGLVVLLVSGCAGDDPAAPEQHDTGYTELAVADIGPAGGEVTGDQLTVSVPPDCFSAQATITISASSGGRPFGDDQLTRTYRLSGLPEDFDRPIGLSVDYEAKADPDQAFLALGEEGFCRSQGNTTVRYRVLPGTAADSVVVAEIPVPETSRSGDGGGSGGFWFDVSVITGYTVYFTPQGHFRIGIPLSHLENHVQLGQYLEEAYQRFLDLGFRYHARTNWPLTVTLKTLEDDGGAMSSRLGDNHGYLELALEILDDLPTMRVTCGHEFFHIVQGFYDPRAPMIQAAEPSAHYWLDEAAAVWSEELFTSTPDYASEARNGNQMAPFRGMHAGAETDAQFHGYGMSAVLKYLVDRYGTSFLPTIYGAIADGLHPVAAVCRRDPAEWWEAFMIAYVMGEVYNDVSRATWYTNAEDRWEISGPADTLATWSQGYPDCAAAVYGIRLTNPGLTPRDQLVFSLAGAEEGHLSLFRYNTTTLEFIASDRSSITLPDLQTMMIQGWSLFALVTNNLHGPPYTTVRQLTLQARLPGSDDLFAATGCRLELNDFYVTYRFSDGSTSGGNLNRTFEVTSGTWNGNTFHGIDQGSRTDEVSMTVDPVTRRITSYSVRTTTPQQDLLVEGAVPVAPATDPTVFLAEYRLSGQGVCTHTTNVDFSNNWGTDLINYYCDGASLLRVVFW